MTECVDGTVLPTLHALRNCVAAQLGACNRPVCRFPIVFNGGHPPADACHCECPDQQGDGQAWVRLVTLNRASGTGTMPSPCFTGQFDLTLETGLYRCYPVPTGNEAALPEHVETEAAEGMHLDAALLRRAVLCCTWLTTRDMTPDIVSQSAIGPSGGCIGIELRFTVQSAECPCPDQQEPGVTGW